MSKSTRRLAAVCAATALFLLAESRSAVPSKPNILVIVGDDMGYGDVGVHGCRDIPTPSIDSIARNGVRAASGYVSGPYCSPTRAGLMTGRYQQRFGHEFNPGPAQTSDAKFGLSLDETTMAEHLRRAGYATGMVGKWHLGYTPQFHPMKRGFGEYFGFLGGAHSYIDARADRSNSILRGTEPVDEPEYLTDAFRREALQFIERHNKEPWFLYWTFNAVHMPLQAVQKYLDRFPGIADERRRTYAAMMVAMDDAIGAALDRLRKLGLEERTLIFFISDNGGPPVNASSNGPLRGHKAQTWEGGIRVPFLVQWKDQIPAGKVYDAPVIQLDILPTALAAAGVAVRPEWKLDGVNLLPYLKGEKKGAPHEMLLWRFGQQMAIRMGDWKLVKAPDTGPAAPLRRRAGATTSGAQLFNLTRDIGETTNLAEKEPAIAGRLEAAWKKWNADLQEPRWLPNEGGRARAGSRPRRRGDDEP
jgi:arylsulfatase A-like enzyme